jgi:hypothetical protein
MASSRAGDLAAMHDDRENILRVTLRAGLGWRRE